MRFGVNYIDAARVYNNGRCELGVAAFNRHAKARDKMWITSKSERHTAIGFEEELATSLKKLETNYVDLYFLHGLKDPSVFTPALRKTVARLKKAGKLRHFGFSCHNNNVPELLHVAAKTPWVDAVMFRYNFRQYGDRKLNEAMDAAHKSGVGLIAMKTQGAEASFSDAWKKFEKTGKWNKHQAVLKAVWADKRITAAVSHMDDLDKLRQNIAAAVDRQKLSRNEVDALRRYAALTRVHACDGCDHICGPSAGGSVRIADTMRYLMYHDGYGQKSEARTLFSQLPPEARSLGGIDFSAASRACPHGVDIGMQMNRALTVLS
jgi:predicted aldo/keto reductase-like oxidoreductase